MSRPNLIIFVILCLIGGVGSCHPEFNSGSRIYKNWIPNQVWNDIPGYKESIYG